MAKAKKKENLTPEERLQAALVPDWEQPYKVPANWCWVKFGYLATDIADGPFGSNLKSEHYTQEKEVRIIQLSNIGENGWREENTKYTTFLHAESISRSIVQPGDLVIAKMMPAGRAIICPNNEAKYVLSSDAVKFVPYRQISTKFLLYSINSNYFQCQVQGNTQGITRARTSIKKLKCYAFALPPLPEQQRIVDRIESLFAKLDEAKQKAQDALDSFETRKAAILHKAFTGELTARWRKEHGLGMESWEQKEIGQIAFVTKLAGFEYTKNIAPNLADAGIPLFKGKNVQKGELVLDFESYIPENISNELPRSQLNRKCLLTPYVGTIGNIAIFDGSFKAHLGSNVGKIEINSDTYEEYVLYYLRSDFGYKELTKHKKATAQESISIQAIREVIIKIPSQQEQNEIVRILDDILAKEQQAKEAAEAVLEQIDLMKKSILARAFRGELGTNNPTEESAVELVKKII